MSMDQALNSLPVIDNEAAIKVAGNNPQIAEELLAFLRKTLREEVLAITQAFKDNELTELLQRVHKLHGGVSYCGLPRLKRTLGMLEISLKKNVLAELPQLITSLQAETELVMNSP